MTTTDPPVPGRTARLALAAFMTGAGVMHFVKPAFFEALVPSWFGHEKATVAISGAAEIAAGALLVSERTRRIGGWWTLAVLIGVYPANIQAAIDAAPPKTGEDWAMVIRLPLQFPLFAWAWRQTR